MRLRTETPEATPSLPVAPMLDMAFQVLAFFILIYHPTTSERAIPVNVSGSHPTPNWAEAHPRIGIDIAIDSSNQHGVVYRLRSEEQNSSAVCDFETLRDHLKSCRPGTSVTIFAQPAIAMSAVMAAVDAAAAAGLSTINFGEPAVPRPVRR